METEESWTVQSRAERTGWLGGRGCLVWVHRVRAGRLGNLSVLKVGRDHRGDLASLNPAVRAENAMTRVKVEWE